MLSVNQIASLVRQQAYDRLLERVLSNGRSTAPGTYQQLTTPADLVPAAIGLGLARVAELVWQPHEAGRELVAALAQRQRPSGLFSSAGPGAVTGTAVGLLGLHAWREVLIECRVEDLTEDPIECGIASGARALGQSRCPTAGPAPGPTPGWNPIQKLTLMIDRATDALASSEEPVPQVILTPGQLVLVQRTPPETSRIAGFSAAAA